MATTEQLNSALADRYAVERLVGEGGMATVYLARDIKHNRRVALKVLKPDLGAIVGVERFLSEIQVTANLQHPNLLPLFDSGAADEVLYYVMPFVEGESLRARLDREKQLPIDDALHIATAVASALDYAHRHGVIHRDLKPENILLHEGQPLVADFGIALALSNAGGNRITQTGLSLGTPAYMSPEQATGDRTIDARTDVYALGAVTYEMLTGEAPHTGSTSQAIIARVLTEKPRSIRSSRPSVPAQVEGAIEHALEKLPADRWATAKEFAEALSGARPATTSTAWSAPASAMSDVEAAASRRQLRSALAVAVVAGVLALGGIATSVALATRRPPTPVPGRFLIELPDSVSIVDGPGPKLAVSRDGSEFVVTGVKAGHQALYLRRSNEVRAEIVSGTDGALYPSFSPDGHWLLFRSGTHLMKVAATGGAPRTLVDSAAGASWGDGDVIVYHVGRNVWRMNAEASERRLLVAADSSRGIYNYAWPEVLPGGKAALITLWRGTSYLDSARLGVVDLANGRVTDLGVRGTNPHYVAPGYLVFGQSGQSVAAAPFSLRKLAITGPAAVLLEGIWQGSGGATDFAVSDNGTLVYRGGGFGHPVLMSVVDRQGVARQLPFAPQTFNEPRVSPTDGRHVAVSIGSPTSPATDVWIYDLAGGTRSRLTTDTVSNRPEWARDGTRVVYLTHPALRDSVVLISRAWDQSGEPTVVAHVGRNAIAEVSIGLPHGWSAIRSGSVNNVPNADIQLAPTDSLGATRPFINTSADEFEPRVSPNGHLIAYTSDESNQNEVYVRQIPGPGPRVSVSVAGGSEPVWSPDGSTLFYRGPARMMSAVVVERPALAVERRDSLFLDTYRRFTAATGYDVFPNGREFLMLSQQVPNDSKVYVVVNWTQLMGKQAGTVEKQ